MIRIDKFLISIFLVINYSCVPVIHNKKKFDIQIHSHIIMRKILIFTLLLFLTSCYYQRTSSGKKRYIVNLFKMKLVNNDSLFKVIDTTKLYGLKSVLSLTDNEYVYPFKQIYLKFYGKNKVGMFYSFDIDDTGTLNPKKADMGYYNYIKGILTTKIYFENPQSEGYIKENNIIIQKDKNLIKFKTNYYEDEYEVIDLPKVFLIYKPDW